MKNTQVKKSFGLIVSVCDAHLCDKKTRVAIDSSLTSVNDELVNSDKLREENELLKKQIIELTKTKEDDKNTLSH